jgi:uncharacterized phage protein (TIGR01671 family)
MNNKKQMPPPEFRIWIIDKKEMFIPDLLLLQHPDSPIINIKEPFASAVNKTDRPLRIFYEAWGIFNSGNEDPPTILMQYTGFQDARSQKIFAGDIVSPMSDPEHERRYWEVKHEFGCFWINDAPIFDYAVYIDNAPTYQLEDLEIVANVYEDKELLG